MTTATARLDAIGLVVSDMRKTLNFYRLLGLTLPEDPGTEDHVEATLEGGLRVMFDTEVLIKSLMPTWTPAQGGHRLGLAFHCETPAGVDAMFERVVAAGFVGAKAPWDAFWGQRYAQLQDPDGNVVDLFAPLAAT
ncbi:MAG: VOC family protein [Deltaproteobacteria bacterium]|nr:VOC family protein [Deltaproteobacteria bacterium]